MTARYGEYRPEPHPGRVRPERPNTIRPVLIQSHYFVSAYLRYVCSLLVFAGILLVLARTFHDRLLTAEIHGWLSRNICGPVPLSLISESVHRRFTFWEHARSWELSYSEYTTATVEPPARVYLEAYAHLLADLFSFAPVAAGLVVGGLAALVLQRTVGS